MERCDECGFDYRDGRAPGTAASVRDAATAFVELLGGDPARLRRQPSPEVWSALEYACHVRDVLLAQRERLYLALVEEEPSFAPIYRDERARLARYAQQPPPRVAAELVCAGELFADARDGLDEDQLARTCIYNYPEPSVRSLAWLARHTLHECEHHLLDARRSFGDDPAVR
jgi:DinB superfamily